VSELVRWHERTAPELRAAAEAGAVAVWPLGSTEQHGPHLVTAFDAAAATAVAEAAIARAQAPAVCLPPLRLGASEHWLALGGTLSLRPATLIAVLEDVIRSVELAGFRALVLVNGHMGNVGPALAALGPRALHVELVSWWGLL
jgi:creatinine amidohydrolase